MAGFRIAEVFAELTLRGEGAFNKKIDGILTNVTRIGLGITQLQTIANRFMIGLTAAGGFSLKQYMDMAHGNDMLKASLRATGQEVERNYHALDEWASAFKKKSTQDDDSLKLVMTRLINLGAAAKDVQSITQLGVGLGRALFGGDSMQGAEAFYKATQGEFREISRLIPAIKHARDENEAYAIVTKIANQGLKLEAEHTATLSGKLTRLWTTVQDTAKVYGELLVPAVTRAVDGLERFLSIASSLSSSQKEFAARLVGVAAALASVVIIGPKVYAIMDSFINMFFGAAKSIIYMGQVLTSIIIGPFGVFLAGAGLIALSLAYIAGSGETMAEQLLSGFGAVGAGLDLLLGSFEGLKTGATVIWLSLTDFLVSTWWTAFEAMQKVWENLKAGARTAIVIIGQYIEGIQDKIALSYAVGEAGRQAETNFYNKTGGPKNSDDDAFFKKLGEEKAKAEAEARNYFDKDHRKQMEENAKKHNDELIKIDDDLNSRLKYNKDQLEQERKEQNAKAEREMNEQIEKMSKLPTLSEGLAKLLEKIKKGSGLADIMNDFKELADKFNQLDPNKVDQMGRGPKAPNLNVPQKDLKFTSLEEAFKKNIAVSLLGDDFKRKEIEDAKKYREEAARVRRGLLGHVANISANIERVGSMV